MPIDQADQRREGARRGMQADRERVQQQERPAQEPDIGMCTDAAQQRAEGKDEDSQRDDIGEKTEVHSVPLESAARANATLPCI